MVSKRLRELSARAVFIVYSQFIKLKNYIMKSIVLFFALLISFSTAYSQSFPFPQHTQYKGTYIKPNYTQQQLDNDVTTFYNSWKTKYLINGCETNQYYIYFDDGNTITVSEAMGYGFMIIPLMAGYDTNAKTYFDGLYRYYKAHPSHIMARLMAWKQITNCIDSDGPDSATDGDIDIAFGLLLAHAQWGSAGAINYFQEAQLMIQDIMGANRSQGDINQDYYSVKLGDWVTSGSRMKATRTSDFIMDHFRLFASAVSDTSWNAVIDECYTLVDSMQTNYSPSTGLLPDFIVDLHTSPRPADPDFLEGSLDGDYSYNACRDPWRMTSDYLTSGDIRGRNATLKIATWLHDTTNQNINKVYAGYYLDGTRAANWNDNSFTAPFTVGAMLDTAHQAWLNTLYNEMKGFYSNGGYYDNTLALLSLITISGNYWVPDTSLMNGIFSSERSQVDIFNLESNLVQNKLKLNFNNKNHFSDYNIKIMDMVGQTVWAGESNNSRSIDIDTSFLKNGMYIVYGVDINNSQIVESEKFIITK